MKLTILQREILRQLRAGRRMLHYAYSPGVNIPAHTIWADEHGTFWGRKNYNIPMRALHRKGLVDLIHTGVRGETEVKLTGAGMNHD